MSTIKNTDLSIIILSYKSKDHLSVLLPSIMESEGVEFGSSVVSPFIGSEDVQEADKSARYTAEVIVVDNDSQDGTFEWLKEYISLSADKHIRVIPNVNNGFSKGNNLGIKQSSGRYVLLLNPDTKVSPETFKTMIEFMDSRPDVGISGCKLIKADGTLDLACRRRFPNPWNSFARLFLRSNTNYNYSNIDINESMEADSVVGAFLMIRREAMEKIGLLDEDFFMYGEDLDWCWRCKEAGYKVWYYPKTTVVHYKGESSKKRPFRSLRVFYDAMWIFYKKHYRQHYPFFFNWLVWLGIYGRLTMLYIINIFKKNPAVSK